MEDDFTLMESSTMRLTNIPASPYQHSAATMQRSSDLCTQNQSACIQGTDSPCCHK